jgi:hypothetical protein
MKVLRKEQAAVTSCKLYGLLILRSLIYAKILDTMEEHGCL